jgi:hypothetical protein
MVRSYWMGAAVLGLAVTGLARGQKPPQAGGPALVAPGENTVTVAEPGKPGQVCKILKSWKKRDGAWVHQVQSLKTGEMMTIEESAPAAGSPGSRLRATARRVFHWGRSTTPPPGAPLPPPDTAAVAPPPQARPPAPVAPPSPVRPVTAAAQPSGICPAGVQITWPSAYADHPIGPGRAPIPMPGTGSEVVNPSVTPQESAAPPVPQADAGPAPVAAEEAPPRRRLLSRLFGRDKEGDCAEEIFSAPPGQGVCQPHSAVVQAPAMPPAPRMTPVPAPMLAPPAASAANTQPDYARRASAVPGAPAPAVAASRTAPTAAPAPVVVQGPAPAPVIKSAPAPVIVGATAKPLAGEPVIVNKGADGGHACVAGEPVIVTGPRCPPQSRTLKPSDEKVTTVVTSTPVIVTPEPKGKPGEPAKVPVIVSGPVSEKATTPSATACNACVPTGAPRPGVAVGAGAPKPTPTVVKAGDWRESWGNAAPKAETVAPRPTAWSQPDRPAAPRADRIVFPKAEDRKSDPLSDPASYSRLARQDLARKPADPAGATPRSAATGPAGRLGPQGVQVAATEGNAFSPPQPAVPPPAPPTMGNAFAAAQAGQPAPPTQAGYMPPALPTPPAPPGYALGRPYHPPAPRYVTGGTPTGLVNAFTPASNARPIPADFGPPQFAANGFSDPDQPVAALRPPQPVPPPMPGYFPPMAARGYGPAPYGRPIAQAGPALSPPQLLATLRDSLLPSQREWAADQLAGVDWRANPQAVDALVTAAHSDPAATVRVGCVRALAKMKANAGPVVAAVEGLRRDADPRVRQEAVEALTALGGAAPRNDPGVRPASASGPALR